MNYLKLFPQYLKANKFNNFKTLAQQCRNFRGISYNDDNLILKFDNAHEHYPLVWLRDNCNCTECFHQNSYSRIIDWNKFNPDVNIKKVEANTSDDGIMIEWNDNHKSLFNFKWLKERSFVKRNNNSDRSSKILWSGNEFTSIAKKYDYHNVMTSDKTLYNWIKDLANYGIVLLENSTTNKSANRQLAERVAFVRKTHYEDEFKVVAKEDTTNVAYMSNALQFHTDLPYYDYVPGIVNLHCVTQSEGGETLLCDGFYVAEKLRNENKQVFDMLTAVDVNWLDVGADEGKTFHSKFTAPMISLNSKGKIEKIRHSIPQRDSHFTVDPKVVKPWYKALRVFVDMLNTHSVKLKMKPGEMIAFDNTRIIHGREQYIDSEDNHRCIIGVCMDWDELNSKLKVLENA